MAQVIFDNLVQNGYSVFMDKRLERGEFAPQIKAAVEKRRNFILVLFPKDLDNCNSENDWIRKKSEWAAATANMNFIPVFLRQLCNKRNRCFRSAKNDVAGKLSNDVVSLRTQTQN